ncbi:MAG: methylenetetrahydrofolate reductase [NAD(P)H] [Christensenellales bacterium]|jgi:methylenetetrahydrofolate reductase (NADPH)
MKLSEMYKKRKPVISFEVFPPKPDSSLDNIYETVEKLSTLSPAYFSVTYGASGGNRERTVEIASTIKNRFKVESLAHLTCTCTTPDDIDRYLDELDANGVENVLALRGDVPKGMERNQAFVGYHHANELVSHITNRNSFCVASAAYPEWHFESQSPEEDIYYLKKKVDAGAEFFISQLCFDNQAFFIFLDRLRRANIHIPVSAGLMPILDPSQILRMTSLSGCSIPAALSKLMARYTDKDDFAKAGLEYAANQYMQLYAAGVDGIHLYSMNRHSQIMQIVRQ